MSIRANFVPTSPTSAVRNTVGKGNEQKQENPKGAASDAALREYCDNHYHQLFPLIAEKVHQEKVQQEKLKEVKAHLNFERCSRRNSRTQETSQYSESRTPNLRGEHGRRRRSRRFRNMSRSPEPKSVFSRIRCDRSESPRHRDPERRTVHARLGRREKGIFNRLRVKEEVCLHTRMTLSPRNTGMPKGKRRAVTKVPAHGERKRSQKEKIVEEGIGSQDRKCKNQALKKTTYPNHGCAKK
ncbi:hypothetical protein Tco_0157031 [Tanacetum coccineum]